MMTTTATPERFLRQHDAIIKSKPKPHESIQQTQEKGMSQSPVSEIGYSIRGTSPRAGV
jgi:hypothetical protein